MITNKIISVLFNVSAALINLLPDFTFKIPETVFNGFNSLCSGVGYFLPLRGLSVIFLLWVSYNGVRIVFSIIIRAFKLSGKG